MVSKCVSICWLIICVLVPTYFDLIITSSYPILLEHGWLFMSSFINQSLAFVWSLAQSSIQLISVVPNVRSPLLSPNSRQPRPIEGIDEQTSQFIQQCPLLAASFPHFGAGIWIN